MARNAMGWFGWFSVAGAVILGALYVLDLANTAAWPVSRSLTLTLALLAGIGALALYFGNDPTASRDRDTVTR